MDTAPDLARDDVDEMIGVLKSKGVPVLWVGLPVVRGPKATADTAFLDALYRDAAGKAGITYVDVWDGFVDEAGRFSQQGPDFEGQIRRLRSSDGVYFTKAGALKLLAQSTAARSPSLPDVPTYQEAGVKLTLDQWLGVFVPAGTPPAVAARLNAEMNKALAIAAVRDVFVQSAQEPVGGTPEQFARLARDDFTKYERLARELNIKAN